MTESEHGAIGSITAQNLPLKFTVKYLGCAPSRGLWGVKHTRRPVDQLVSAAKSLTMHETIPPSSLTIGLERVYITPLGTEAPPICFDIDTISYGVQDVVYARVFSMIVVMADIEELAKSSQPFMCHSFVCDSRNQARQITYALSAAFQHYSNQTKNGAGALRKITQILDEETEA